MKMLRMVWLAGLMAIGFYALYSLGNLPSHENDGTEIHVAWAVFYRDILAATWPLLAWAWLGLGGYLWTRWDLRLAGTIFHKPRHDLREKLKDPIPLPKIVLGFIIFWTVAYCLIKMSQLYFTPETAPTPLRELLDPPSNGVNTYPWH